MHFVILVNQLSSSGELLRLFEPMLSISSFIPFASFTFVSESSKKGDMYNVLWALVFGFATLNILSLVAKRFDDRNRMSFGEIMAVLTVVASVFLLGWEMLYWFKILPLRLPAH